MRFTNALVAGIFAFAANAQTTESITSAASSDAPTVTAVPSATTTRELTPEESAQAEVLACVEACDDGDVSCQARCITVPNPDEGAVNDTTSCVADCPQGSGSEADTEAYAACVQGCISDHFLTTTFMGGQPTGTAGSSQASQGSDEVTATPTPSVSTVTSGSSTFETTVTPTSSDSPSATDDSSSEDATDAPGSGAMSFSPIGATGLLGLVAAFFAL